jgi:general secretion pathway protein M
MVDAAGAQLRSVRILPIETEEQHTKIGTRADLHCTTESLLDLLYDIEQARPFLSIDKPSVRSSVRRSTRRTRRARSRRIRRRQPLGQLTVRLDISGYAVVGDR